MAAHHFISYSGVDGGDLALRLATALESADPPLRVWLDRLEKERHGLRPGEFWDVQIDEALRTCQSLIFLMTRDSVEAASVCTQEWTRALKYKKPVIPVQVDGAAEMPFRLDPREAVKLAGGFEAAIARLRNHLQWLSSPAGMLRSLEYRLADAQRALRRADEAERSRVASEVSRLEAEASELREVVSHPDEAARRVQREVTEGLSREREPEARVRAGKRCRVVNAAPGVPPSYFQDRSVETRLLAELIRDPGKRLVFVVGRGGVGKTAMACRLLRSIEEGEPVEDGPPMELDAIVYLSASGTRRISVPALYADLCALLPAERGVELRKLYASPHVTTSAKFERLLGAFDGHKVIVLLDNFEDLMELEKLELRDADLSEAMRAWLDVPAHPVTLIVTTRAAPRDILIEQPARQARIDLEEGLPSPFAENILRAMDVDGTMGLRSAPASLLDEARQRTRGYPRALEALFAILSADRDSTLQDVLAMTERALPDNVVRVLVGEAFSRLDSRAQRVIEALAFYHRPVTASAVDYLLLPYLDGFSSASSLGRLVNMRFVKKEGGRYFLHPVDRDYALSRVPRGAPADRRSTPLVYSGFALLDRAAEYFREARTEPSTWKELADLTVPLAEFDLRCEGEDFDGAFDVWLAFGDALITWGHYRLARDLCLRMDGRLPAPRDLWVASSLGSVESRLGRYVSAVSYFDRLLSRTPDLALQVGEAWPLYSIAWCHSQLGDTSRAIEFSERALSAAQRDGDSQMAADIWSILGWYHAQRGDHAQAIACCERGVELLQESQNPNSRATTLANLADVLLDVERYSEAVEHAQSSIRVDPVTRNTLSWNHFLTAWAHLGLGDLDQAFAAAEQARKYDEPENNPFVLALVGIIALLRGRKDAAIEAFRAGVTASDLLLQAARNFRALDAKGLSLAGLAVCGAAPIGAAVEAHRAAREINRDAGVVHRLLWQYHRLATVDPDSQLAPARAAAEGPRE